MIVKKHNVTGITAFNKFIVKVVVAGKVVWELISSCFGSGYWINDRPWINDDAWSNG